MANAGGREGATQRNVRATYATHVLAGRPGYIATIQDSGLHFAGNCSEIQVHAGVRKPA